MNLNREINLNKKVIVFLILFSVIGISFYYSYALFQVDDIKHNAIILKTATGLDITTTVDNTNTDTFTLNGNQTKEVTIKLDTNGITSAMAYKMYYEITNGEGVFRVTLPNESTESFENNKVEGIMQPYDRENNTKITGKEFTLTFTNTSTIPMTIKLGAIGGFEKSGAALTTQDELVLNKSLPIPKVQNNKQYIMVKVRNYDNENEIGELLANDDNMRLEVSGTNTTFTYMDSLGNNEINTSSSLDLTYTMSKKRSIDVQIFMTPTNGLDSNTDINIRLSKNGTTVYEIVHNVDLVENNYCIRRGFGKLHDCILVSENNSSSVNDAKTYITNKGYPNLNQTAPTYVYIEEESSNQTYTGTAGYKWYFADKYFFDSATGKFTLKKSDGTTTENTQVELTNDAIGKYTCGTTNINNICQTIYKVSSVNTSTRQITGQMITNKVASTLQGETGLYKTNDNQGETYFYRGDVKNNNVLFGGYYWKIVRINGDGSIRLIFNGNTPEMGKNNNAIANNDNGYGATYTYNPVHGGPTYVGYMYNEEDSVWESGATNHTDFNVTYSYYWGNQNDFEELEDEYGTYFKLKSNNNAVPKTIVEMSNDATQLAATPYTCKGTNITDTCRVLYKVNSITIGNNNSVTTSTNYYTKSPNTNDLSIVNANNKDSNVKKQLESWYENKLMNKINNGNQVSDYIVDNIWCNDRSITGTGTNYSGYKLTEDTYFAGYNRFTSANKTATLICQNDNDKFSKTASYGNAKLKYPVGLITADEVALAGGKFNEKNSDYYLRTDGYFWTMTPSFFAANYASAYVLSVNSEGFLYRYYFYYSFGVRAVINLNSNTLISEGDGSAEHPYQLKLS